jgi:hypothetical protein
VVQPKLASAAVWCGTAAGTAQTLGALWNETPDAAADMRRRRHWVFALPNV